MKTFGKVLLGVVAVGVALGALVWYTTRDESYLDDDYDDDFEEDDDYDDYDDFDDFDDEDDIQDGAASSEKDTEDVDGEEKA